MIRTNFNKYCYIFSGLATLILALTTLIMHHTISENKKLTHSMTQEIQSLKKEMKDNESYRQNEKERLASYFFKENAFKLKHPTYTKITESVFKNSKKYGFNPYVIMALIQIESNFDPDAVSTSGAYGVMQVNASAWQKDLNINMNRIHEIDYNINLGLKILKYYYERSSHDILLALYRYNNGYKYTNTKFGDKVSSTAFYANKQKAGSHKDRSYEVTR